jgi:hypothetical protein
MFWIDEGDVEDWDGVDEAVDCCVIIDSYLDVLDFRHKGEQ